MSADNWAKCPNCSSKAKDHNCDCGCNPSEATYTLREDYEIGIYNGRFNVSYSAECIDNYAKDKDAKDAGCGFKHEFKFEEGVG